MQTIVTYSVVTVIVTAIHSKSAWRKNPSLLYKLNRFGFHKTYKISSCSIKNTWWCLKFLQICPHKTKARNVTCVKTQMKLQCDLSKRIQNKVWTGAIDHTLETVCVFYRFKRRSRTTPEESKFTKRTFPGFVMP